jgi:hypothetical protein
MAVKMDGSAASAPTATVVSGVIIGCESARKTEVTERLHFALNIELCCCRLEVRRELIHARWPRLLTSNHLVTGTIGSDEALPAYLQFGSLELAASRQSSVTAIKPLDEVRAQLPPTRAIGWEDHIPCHTPRTITLPHSKARV